MKKGSDAVEAVEKRKQTIINILYVGMILGLLYLVLKYAFWLLFPFILAFFVAAILQKPVNFLSRKTPIKKGVWSGILVLLITAVLIVLLVLTGARIVSEAQDLVKWVGERMATLPELLETIRVKLLSLAAKLPAGLAKSASDSIDELFRSAAGTASEAAAGEATQETASGLSVLGGIFSKINLSTLSKPVSGVWNTAKQIPSIAAATLISIIAGCFMTAGYDDIVSFIKRQLPVQKRVALSAAKGIFFSSILKILKSYLIIICITFAEMCLGLTLLKLIGAYTSGYIATVSVAVALIDIFPVLGTGTVLIPWAIISFITGKVGLGIGLLILYAVITVIRQIVEPKLVAANLGLPPVVTIMCMYIGLQLFGVPGIFIMPLIITMIKLLNDRGILHVWKTKQQDELAAEVEADAEN